ncbi:hypothetical protein [Paracoccus lutimaris]|uniref:Uncharacterized protein n=1 Tax=Paracoccus lutimaris TaxID=1490030 RepID=A0A368YPF3_9RHOB|nr:hypothetical protein [Paracoccus lutimaris]RCW82112.1 hypothetical protein DFP89_11372 [Paracoccus lutimaris]
MLAAYGWLCSVPRTELLVFLEKRGCVIGPAKRQAAREAGFPDAMIEAFAQHASRAGKAEMQGE